MNPPPQFTFTMMNMLSNVRSYTAAGAKPPRVPTRHPHKRGLHERYGERSVDKKKAKEKPTSTGCYN
jgi:hypothetical protein